MTTARNWARFQLALLPERSLFVKRNHRNSPPPFSTTSKTVGVGSPSYGCAWYDTSIPSVSLQFCARTNHDLSDDGTVVATSGTCVPASDILPNPSVLHTSNVKYNSLIRTRIPSPRWQIVAFKFSVLFDHNLQTKRPPSTIGVIWSLYW
jgi:hypothetical protein